MVVIGGGDAGITAAKRAAFSGAKTCLIEQDMVGGHKLHFGAIPLTAFMHAAKMYDQARNS